MIDNKYKDAFKEVHKILQNVDDELLKKVPQKFINFLQDNMNAYYKVNINSNIEIDRQKLLAETEDILALIYRSYWATDEEKQEFLGKDIQELRSIEEYKKNRYKDITEIFEKKRNLNNVTLNNELIVIQEDNFIKKLFKKILEIFKREYRKSCVKGSFRDKIKNIKEGFFYGKKSRKRKK